MNSILVFDEARYISSHMVDYLIDLGSGMNCMAKFYECDISELSHASQWQSKQVGVYS